MAADRVLAPDEITRLADKLAGTPDSIDATVEALFGCDFLDVDIGSLKVLDSLVFCCDTCGWWCRDEERGTEETCKECEG